MSDAIGSAYGTHSILPVTHTSSETDPRQSHAVRARVYFGLQGDTPWNTGA